MKKIAKYLLASTCVASLPIVGMTSCNQKTEIKSEVYVNDTSYLKSDVVVDKIYNSTSFTFTIELEENCFINQHSSYVRCGLNSSHAFNGRYVKLTNIEGNKYTYTVSQTIVEGEFVHIYVSLNKEWNVDVSGTSKDEFTFDTVLKAVNNEAYLIWFKIATSKGLDINESSITIGGQKLSNDSYLTFEETIEDEIYTFIRIPSSKVTGDIKFNLVAGEAVSTEIINRPEYTTYYMSKPVAGNDFYCYYELADSYDYALDTELAEVKINEETLTLNEDYVIGESPLGYTYIKINGNKVNNKIQIDVPVVELFNCYACHSYEYPTVHVISEPFKKNKANYTFKVTPLNGKTIDWKNSNTYISVGDTQLTCDENLSSGKFTATEDTTTGTWTITVSQVDTVNDMYCHFITK